MTGNSNVTQLGKGCRRLRNSVCHAILSDGRLDYFSPRISGVKVTPTSNPSGEMKRLTVWPHGSFLFLTSIRYPCDSRLAVAFSTLSTSNSSQACGMGILSGQASLPKHDSAASDNGQSAKLFAALRAS